MLDVREKKMMSMSDEMVGLMESNQTLQGELEAAREMSSSNVEDMREEFTKRIGTSEKKLQAVTKVLRNTRLDSLSCSTITVFP